jgi:hypothetical protein
VSAWCDGSLRLRQRSQAGPKVRLEIFLLCCGIWEERVSAWCDGSLRLSLELTPHKYELGQLNFGRAR